MAAMEDSFLAQGCRGGQLPHPRLPWRIASPATTVLVDASLPQAELLTGQPVPDLPSAYKAVETLLTRGPDCVVLTLGEKGVLFSGRGKWAGPEEGFRHVPAERVDVVDTTVSRSHSVCVCACIAYALN